MSGKAGDRMREGRAAPHSDWRVWQDAEVARKFAEDRRKGILGGAQQLEVLGELLPAVEHGRVLDMGCGDGVLLETVLQRWPDAQGVALDGSPAMLERARERLSAFAPKVAFVPADFNQSNWMTKLPFAEYDAVVSGFAIHHSEDERKRALYAEIFALLRPGGVFVNIEHVASVSPRGEKLFERAYALNLARVRQANGEAATYEEVLRELTDRLDKSANRLTLVETQLEWLRVLGYTEVDCYWKRYELAIFAGYKPQSRD